MFCRLRVEVIVTTGICASAVSVGSAVTAGATGEMGELGCGNNEVLVADGTDASVDVGPKILVGGADVGVLVMESGALVRGCRR